MEKENVQGLVLGPYRYRRSRHLFFTLPAGASDGRGFIRELLPHLTHGGTVFSEGQPLWLCNVGLTFEGLTRLGCDPGLARALDRDFRDGPSPESLSDVPGSKSDRRNWWDGQWQTNRIHVTVQLHAREAPELEDATTTVLGMASAAGWEELLPRKLPDHNGSRRLDGAALPRAAGDTQPGSRVHFGYRDGLSQPEVAWDGMPSGNELDRSHFLLGYSSAQVPSAPSTGAAAEFFRDSSYMALRWLQQDVAVFEKYLTDTAPLLSPERPLAEGREFVAAKLMGRWRDGTPLTLSPDRPDPALISSPFDYRTQDPDGLRCPFSAHIRVVNPRDQPLSAAEVTGVPRVLRRGMPYGPEWPAGQIHDDGIDRGTIGVFLCTSISRQIYTMLHWVSTTNFSPVYEPGSLHDQDALCGNRKFPRATGSMSVPAAGGALRLSGLPDFIHTRGTAFFILPGIKTLRKLAE